MNPSGDPLDRLRGHRVAGGPLTRRRFTRILGLEPEALPFEVSGVEWVDEHIAIVVTRPSAGNVHLELLAAAPGLEGLVGTQHLVVRYRGRDLPELLAAAITRSVRRRLATVQLGRLAALILDDPECVGVPERDAAAPPASTGAKSAGPLRGHRKAGGAHSIERFTALLGLDGADPAGHRIESIAWVSDHVELAIIVDGDGQSVRFLISAREPGARGVVTTSHLVVGYEAKELPQRLEDAIRRTAPARLAPLTIDGLAALMAADPELGDPGLPIPSTKHTHPTNMVDTWAGRDAYCDFFAGGEIARCQLDSVSFNRCFRNVQHCDMECLLVNPHRNGTEPVMLVDYPWEDRTRNVAAPAHEIAGEDRPDLWSEDDAMVATDLVERDVIMGSQDKLRAALDAVISRPNPAGKPIFVANTCVPTVTGEDVESVVAEYRQKTDQPLLYLTVSPKSMNDVFVDLFQTQRLAAEAQAGPPDPGRINLIGFPDTRAVRELIRLLDRIGVGVNQLLLPDLEPERIARLPDAALSVFRPNRAWAHMYEQLQTGTRIEHITPPAPYGLERTRQWAHAIASRLGRADGFDRVWPELAAADEAGFAGVSSAVKGRRLGMVVRAGETHYLTEPAETWGIPLLAVCEEAGFGLDILLAAGSERTARAMRERISAGLQRPQDHRLSTVRSFSELRKRLRDSECECVLSNHFYDWRLSEAGKSRFSLQLFEMGLAGATRTVQRLLEVCEAPFFRRYARYLKRTPDGLRR